MKVEEFMKRHGIGIGDYVKLVKLEDGEKIEYKGLVMPPYELSEGDTLVIKLDNGYNIGIAVDKITSIEVIERA
ncbi:Glu-tRNA(Gln) amidotransferase GatDE subunit D, partial [Thermococci archaeon]